MTVRWLPGICAMVGMELSLNRPQWSQPSEASGRAALFDQTISIPVPDEFVEEAAFRRSPVECSKSPRRHALIVIAIAARDKPDRKDTLSGVIVHVLDHRRRHLPTLDIASGVTRHETQGSVEIKCWRSDGKVGRRVTNGIQHPAARKPDCGRTAVGIGPATVSSLGAVIPRQAGRRNPSVWRAGLAGSWFRRQAG